MFLIFEILAPLFEITDFLDGVHGVAVQAIADSQRLLPNKSRIIKLIQITSRFDVSINKKASSVNDIGAALGLGV